MLGCMPATTGSGAIQLAIWPGNIPGEEAPQRWQYAKPLVYTQADEKKTD